MFRPLRRKTKAIPDEIAKKLLHTERRGVLAVNGDGGYPYAIPVNFYYDEPNGKIYFHGAKEGHKTDSLRKNDKICFTVYGNEIIDEKTPWAPYMQSVVIFGRCRLIDSPDETLSHVHTLAEKYYPGEEEISREIAKDIKGVQLYEITIEHLCGKQIQEK